MPLQSRLDLQHVPGKAFSTSSKIHHPRAIQSLRHPAPELTPFIASKSIVPGWASFVWVSRPNASPPHRRGWIGSVLEIAKCHRHSPCSRWISAPLRIGGAALERLQRKIWFYPPRRVTGGCKSPVLAAGCDVIETGHFRGGPDRAGEVTCLEGSEPLAINQRAAGKNWGPPPKGGRARERHADQAPHVAGSIGPTTKLPTLGHIGPSMR